MLLEAETTGHTLALAHHGERGRGAGSPPSHACLRLWSRPPHSCRNCTHTHDPHKTYPTPEGGVVCVWMFHLNWLHLFTVRMLCNSCAQFWRTFKMSHFSITKKAAVNLYVSFFFFESVCFCRWNPQTRTAQSKGSKLQPSWLLPPTLIPTAPQTTPVHSATKNTRAFFFLKPYHCAVEMFLIHAIPVSNTNIILIYFS